MKYKKSLIVVDPSLRDFDGHHFEYSRSLYNESQIRRYGFSVLANRSVSPEVVSAIQANPVFRYRTWPILNNMPLKSIDPVFSNTFFYGDLNRSLNNRNVDTQTILFMPTVSHGQMIAWAWWLRRSHCTGPLRVILMLRYHYYNIEMERNSRWLYWLKFGLRLIEPLALQHRIGIVTDSHRLAKEYTEYTCLPILVLPIPHTMISDARNATASEDKPISSNIAIRITMLGEARTEKGFPLLVKSLQLIIPYLVRGDFEAYIQCDVTSDDEEAKRAVKELRRLDLPNVFFVDEAMDSKDYYLLLRNSDIVLIPYQRACYFSRTSGILAEAFAAGKPVITTHDTWMSTQVDIGGAGVLFRDGDAQDLARAIIEAGKNYDELAVKARKWQSEWLARHNAASLFDALESIAGLR